MPQFRCQTKYLQSKCHKSRIEEIYVFPELDGAFAIDVKNSAATDESDIDKIALITRGNLIVASDVAPILMTICNNRSNGETGRVTFAALFGQVSVKSTFGLVDENCP